MKKLAHRGAIQIGEITVMTEVSTLNQGKEQPIKASEIDPTFKYELEKIPGAEKILLCFQCGTCTSDCPIARFSDNYRPRTLIHMAQLGLKDRVLNSATLWLCSACFTCTDRCPQNVEVDSIIRVFRNLAVKKGYIPQGLCNQAQSLLETGYVAKVPESRIRKRENYGLPPLPQGNAEAIKKILRGISFFDSLQTLPKGDNKNDP